MAITIVIDNIAKIAAWELRIGATRVPGDHVDAAPPPESIAHPSPPLGTTQTVSYVTASDVVLFLHYIL